MQRAMIFAQQRGSARLIGDEHAPVPGGEASADSARGGDCGTERNRLCGLASAHVLADQGGPLSHAGGAERAHLGASIRSRLRGAC